MPVRAKVGRGEREIASRAGLSWPLNNTPESPAATATSMAAWKST